jgi:hypothetical protein
MHRLTIVATLLVDVGTPGAGRDCGEKRGERRADRRDPSVSGYARAKRLTGGSYIGARAEGHARACGCADRAGPPGGKGGGRGEAGTRSPAKWAERPG